MSRAHLKPNQPSLALIAIAIVSAYGANVLAETLTRELMQVPGTIQPTAQVGAIEIESDKLEMHLDRNMHAIGNAILHKGDQHIYGDTINYNLQNEELQVEGHARINLGDSEISGTRLKMRLSESIGEMPDASINLNKAYKSKVKEENVPDLIDYTQSRLLNAASILGINPKEYQENVSEPSLPIGQSSLDPKFSSSRGDASSVLFEGQDRKRLKSARFTTCEQGVDDWYIKASEIELDDYTQSATAKNGYIEFQDVPILYVPWVSFSFNNERKSGLLAPTVGTTSKSGFEVSVPYYINIAPDKDATVGVRYLSKRGAQFQGELRYLDETYSGIYNAEYINNDQLSDIKRYYVKLSHNHFIGNGWSAGFNFEKVSDDQYFSELSTRIVSTSRVNLPQEAQINYVDEIWSFNGLVQKYQTLDEISFPYQRLPQLTLVGNKSYDHLTVNIFSQWSYFDQNANAPIAATGSRLAVYPSISIPMSDTYGFFTPKIGLHSTSYRLNDNNFNVNGQSISNDSETRTLPIFSLDSGLYFERDTAIASRQYVQTIEPRLFYVYIPNKNQDLLPVFDTSLADLNLTTLFSENQFTGNDRVNNANQLSLAVTSRMIDQETGIERIAATIGQRFYFSDQNVALPGAIASSSNSSDIVAAMTARLSNQWNLDTFWQYNTDGAGLVRSNLLARYNPEPGKLLNAGYRYTENFLEQINVSGQWPLSRGWYGVGRTNYSIREKALIESLAGLEYDAGCWQMRAVMQRVETATAEANYGMFFQLELGGLASIGSNPLNLLRRDIPGYLSSSEIPNIYRQQNYNR